MIDQIAIVQLKIKDFLLLPNQTKAAAATLKDHSGYMATNGIRGRSSD